MTKCKFFEITFLADIVNEYSSKFAVIVPTDTYDKTAKIEDKTA